MKPNEANKPRGRAAKAVVVAAAVVAIGAMPTPAFADTVTNPDPSTSTASNPAILSAPYAISGTTTLGSGSQAPELELFPYGNGGSGVAPRAYCANTPFTDPTSPEYGNPPVDASGHWTCTLGDPPVMPANGYNGYPYTSASSLQPGTTYVFQSWLDGATSQPAAATTFFQIAPTQAGPVIGSWEVTAGGALAAGGVALLVRRRRKASSLA